MKEKDTTEKIRQRLEITNVPIEDINALKDIAKRKGVPVTVVAKTAIDFYLSSPNKEKKG